MDGLNHWIPAFAGMTAWTKKHLSSRIKVIIFTAALKGSPEPACRRQVKPSGIYLGRLFQTCPRQADAVLPLHPCGRGHAGYSATPPCRKINDWRHCQAVRFWPTPLSAARKP